MCVVRVLPDEPAIGKAFDYLVPDELAGRDLVRIGSLVRVELHGRRVAGWVIADDVVPEPDVVARLLPLAKVRGLGPPAPLIELARWAAWRWAGRLATVLRSASPIHAVRALPDPPLGVPALSPPDDGDDIAELAAGALGKGGVQLLRIAPAIDPFSAVIEAARFGAGRGALVVVGSHARAVAVGRRLRRAGVGVAVMPDDWARAAAGGCVVVGARGAVWAPIADPGAIVVLDEHDEALAEERNPTWHARDVAVERARRAGIPCLLVSALPTLEARRLAGTGVWATSRQRERSGWAALEIVDRTLDEPGRQHVASERLTGALRDAGRVVCVLNRTGRSKLLACAGCGELARCTACDAAVEQPTQEVLVCRRCAAERPVLCAMCGGGRLKLLRIGVARAREEIEALALRPVAEVTASTEGLPEAAVFVGTEAVLHRIGRADVVVFLDFDQELLAPRYRAGEQALALLARASRMVGGRGPGRVIVQTHLPGHPVLEAALAGDPDRVRTMEADRRRALRFPPFAALAAVSGAGAPELVDSLRGTVGIEILGADPGPFLVRAPGSAVLADAFAAVARPAGRVRVEVDPLRV